MLRDGNSTSLRAFSGCEEAISGRNRRESVRSDAEQSLGGNLPKEFFDILVELLLGFLRVFRQNVRGLPSPDEFVVRLSKRSTTRVPTV